MGNDCRGVALLRLLRTGLGEMAFYLGKNLQKKSRVAKIVCFFTANEKVRGITNTIFLQEKDFLSFSLFIRIIFFIFVK